MKILITNLAAAVQTALEAVQLGAYNANITAGLELAPDATVTFSAEVVTASTFNTITRTQSVTPSANEVTTDVTDSYSETTTQTPATTQSDDLSTSGGDSSDVETTYTEYAT